MKRIVIVAVVLALLVVAVGAAAYYAVGQGQTSSKQGQDASDQAQAASTSSAKLASSWPTVVYMTSNQTFFRGNQATCSVPNNETGTVTFWASEDGSTIFYSAWIGATTNIDQITLKLKQNGQVGETVAYLYAPGVMTRSVTKVDQTSGLMVVGNFTSTNFVGPMTGKSMNDLSARINEGNISVIAATSRCPTELRGEFGVFPFQICNVPGHQVNTTTPTPNNPSTQTPQGQFFDNHGPCPGGFCEPMGPGTNQPHEPMGPDHDGGMMGR